VFCFVIGTHSGYGKCEYALGDPLAPAVERLTAMNFLNQAKTRYSLAKQVAKQVSIYRDRLAQEEE
jgi:hypothetical protein